MQRKVVLHALLGLLLIGTRPADAQNFDSQTITMQINSITELAISGDPSPLIVQGAMPGEQPDSMFDTSTRYAITTNMSGKKITGIINSAMPTGCELFAELAQVGGGSSTGSTKLSETVANDLVTGIGTIAESGNMIILGFYASVTAGTVPSFQRTITYTLTDN